MRFTFILPKIFFLISSSVSDNSGEKKTTKCICGIENMVTNAFPQYDFNKFPWMVALRKKVLPLTSQTFKYYTGTLVSDLFVVTVATVFDHPDDRDPELFEAKPGATKWTIPVSNGNQASMDWKPIEKIWLHPYFKSNTDSVRPSKDLSYNVALLKLRDRLKFFNYQASVIINPFFGVRPICLPTPNQTTVEHLPGKEVLKGHRMGKVKTEILSNEECMEEFSQKPR